MRRLLSAHNVKWAAWEHTGGDSTFEQQNYVGHGLEQTIWRRTVGLFEWNDRIDLRDRGMDRDERTTARPAGRSDGLSFGWWSGCWQSDSAETANRCLSSASCATFACFWFECRHLPTTFFEMTYRRCKYLLRLQQMHEYNQITVMINKDADKLRSMGLIASNSLREIVREFRTLDELTRFMNKSSRCDRLSKLNSRLFETPPSF